jgi:predicted DNA-binding transcriptional regulator AlpA
MPNSLDNLPALLSTDQLAELIGVSTSLLKRWRRRGEGPGYTRLGGSIRYEANCVRAWIEAGRVQPRIAAVVP